MLLGGNERGLILCWMAQRRCWWWEREDLDDLHLLKQFCPSPCALLSCSYRPDIRGRSKAFPSLIRQRPRIRRRRGRRDHALSPLSVTKVNLVVCCVLIPRLIMHLAYGVLCFRTPTIDREAYIVDLVPTIVAWGRTESESSLVYLIICMHLCPMAPYSHRDIHLSRQIIY